MKIPFNKPFMTGKELIYVEDAVKSGKISGNGIYTQKCQNFFTDNFSFKKCLLTTSCTDALEMAAILINIKPGDEVIVPSFTFVSTANAFVLRGATIVFADSCSDHPNVDSEKLDQLITPKTKAIVIIHYAGVSCYMDRIIEIANKYNLYLIEDCAQAIDSYYIGNAGNRVPLGSFGQLSAFSFHETKNIISGEGGMLVINDETFFSRSEIIWEKGTNRSAFFRGEVDKYNWVDVGSSFLPSDITAAFLYAQLENLEKIQNKRKELWDIYYTSLSSLADVHPFLLPIIADYATNNAHMFYLICENIEQRTALIKYLQVNGIHSVFHYISLHSSPFYIKNNGDVDLQNADQFSKRLIRLPMYYSLQPKEIEYIVSKVKEFYERKV